MKNDYIVFDTETTGVDADKEILQLSMVNDKGQCIFNEYFKPEHHTSWEEAQAINGISPEMVKDCKPISAYKEQIEDIFRNCDKVVAYNIKFDWEALSKVVDINQFNLQQNDLMILYADKIVKEPIKERKPWMTGEYKWQKLTDCAKHYGFDWFSTKTNAHDSLGDTLATQFCFEAFKNEYLEKLKLEFTLGANEVMVEYFNKDIDKAYEAYSRIDDLNEEVKNIYSTDKDRQLLSNTFNKYFREAIPSTISYDVIVHDEHVKERLNPKEERVAHLTSQIQEFLNVFHEKGVNEENIRKCLLNDEKRDILATKIEHLTLRASFKFGNDDLSNDGWDIFGQMNRMAREGVFQKMAQEQAVVKETAKEQVPQMDRPLTFEERMAQAKVFAQKHNEQMQKQNMKHHDKDAR